MTDFETRLRWLSERGNPVGAEKLIERIEAELAGDPLVFVTIRRERTTMTKTDQSPTTSIPSRYRGPARAAAAFVAVLAVAALYLAFSGDSDEVADTPPPTTVAPDVETMTDLEVIEAGVAAFYSGDAERTVELFEITAFRGIGLEDPEGYDPIRDDAGIRRETAYQAAIGGRLTLNCTEGITPGVFSCNMPYHNALTDAVGYVDSPGDTARVVVHDGVITEFHVPEHEFLRSEAARFLRDQQVDGYEDCVEPGRLVRTPECANVIMAHLGEWAAWTRIEDATAFWEAVEAGDLEAALAHVDPTAELATFGWAGTLEATFDWYEAVGWKWTLNECVEGDAETVECTATAQNAWSDALEVEPVPGIFVLRFGENGITEIVDKADLFLNKWSAQVFEVFAGWVETNHPEDFAIMFDYSGDASAEILDLYETNTNRFVQAQQDE